MNWRGLFKYCFYMIPVLWSSGKDWVWEELSIAEIRINYLFGKANAYDHAHCLERSIRVYRELLKKETNSLPVFLNLGGLYYRRGMFEKAISYYEKVIRLNPKHYQGHYWLAMCYWKMQRHYAAINTLEEIIESLPTFKDALNLLGECYERIGEGARAEHYYLKAIGADPEGRIIHGGILEPWTPERRREERIKH